MSQIANDSKKYYVDVTSKMGGTLFIIQDHTGDFMESVLHHENMRKWLRQHVVFREQVSYDYSNFWSHKWDDLQASHDWLNVWCDL